MAQADDPDSTSVPLDSGLLASVSLLRFPGRPADPAQLRHQFAPDGESFTADHILRAARRLDVKARRERTPPERLEKATLPAIALLKDGSFALLARATADRVLLQDLAANRPAIEQRAAFDARWTGELILMTTREGRIGASRPFDLTWFIPSIVRFRKLLGEALVGSLFLQLFALITPLFTQVVIDKVLVHKGWSTLDVLVFGLVVISVFEILLGGLRSYVLAHTTNRHPCPGRRQGDDRPAIDRPRPDRCRRRRRPSGARAYGPRARRGAARFAPGRRARRAALRGAADADPVLLESARRLLEAQWQERSAKLAALDGEIERPRAKLQGAETDVERFKAVLPLLRATAR